MGAGAMKRLVMVVVTLTMVAVCMILKLIVDHHHDDFGQDKTNWLAHSCARNSDYYNPAHTTDHPFVMPIGGMYVSLRDGGRRPAADCGFHLERCGRRPAADCRRGFHFERCPTATTCPLATIPTHRAPPPTRYFYGPQHAHLENRTAVYMTGEELCTKSKESNRRLARRKAS